MSEWLKILGTVKDQSLIILGLVVLVVLWLSFRLLQSVVQERSGSQLAALTALTAEIKDLSKDITKLATCVDQMLRHQEQCGNYRTNRTRTQD